ncbi:MAG: beta-ketoacyl synthase N-terminal-like domain-containing protein [Anaerolineales bacterium]|nr:beta-ketoacyl synthase N-terminal-like domain-containing protein [Anaerolineales bacterium]
MVDVVIAGIGQTDVGEHWDYSLRELALFALDEARNEAGGIQPQAVYVANMLAPALSRQSHLGALVADFAGLRGIEAVTVEAAGASGGVALRQAYLAVASGASETAMALGVEKITDQVGPPVEAALATTTDSDYEAEQGMTPTSQAALLLRRYLHENDVPREAFAGFPVTAHANGATNPHAMFRKPIKPELYARAGIVSDPLNMFDIAPRADGAAAALLVRADLVPPDFPHPLVTIAGSSVATDALAIHDRPNPLVLRAVNASIERACAQAGIARSDVSFYELDDTYSIYAALSLEAAGFAAPGEGWKLAENGGIGLNGNLPIATFGGAKARGHAGGAAGVYQAVEAVMQLRGQAGDNQVPDAAIGLIQCLGGPGSTAAAHVLARVSD